MEQSDPKNPWLHLQVKVFKSQTPLLLQPFSQDFTPQSSPVHPESHLQDPSTHFPRPLHEFKQLLTKQESPENPGLQKHFPFTHIPLPLQSLGQGVFSHATPNHFLLQ